MDQTNELTKQQKKSRETKERIFQAAKHILKRDGYEQLSIKNICEEAGVSNGSFYHHFKSKDDLLSYYIKDQPNINPELLDPPSNAKDVEDAIIHIYMNYAKHCLELGVEFMAEYYTPKNQTLNPTMHTERTYPIITVQTYLEKAVAAGAVTLSLSLEEVTTDIRIIVIGNVFEWCMRDGKADFEENLKRTLTNYLNNVIK